MLTKEIIVRMLEQDDRAIARALVVLTERQTHDEKIQGQTRYLNGRGYRPCHARMGASMSQFFERNGYLSPKQIAYWRGRDKTGAMRIGIYAGQLLEAAELKAKTFTETKAQIDAATVAQNFPPAAILKAPDLSEDERRELNRLEYNLGDVMDSDDPDLVGPAKDELDAFMLLVKAKRS